MKHIRRALSNVIDARDLFASRGLYEYIATKPLDERNRLPTPVEEREEKTGGFFSRKKRRFLSFSKPLSLKHQRMYGLVALSPHDPVLRQKARRLFDRTTTRAYARGGGRYEIPQAGGNTLVWENNWDDRIPHALVTYNRANDPIDVQEFRVAEDVLDVLWEKLPPSEKEDYALQSIPDVKDVI